MNQQPGSELSKTSETMLEAGNTGKKLQFVLMCLDGTLACSMFGVRLGLRLQGPLTRQGEPSISTLNSTQSLGKATLTLNPGGVSIYFPDFRY